MVHGGGEIIPRFSFIKDNHGSDKLRPGYILFEVSFYLMILNIKRVWVEEEEEVVPFALFYQLLVS